MSNLPLCIAAAAVLLWLASLLLTTRIWQKILAILYGCVCSLGILLCIAGTVNYRNLLRDPIVTGDYASWVRDAMSIALRVGGFLTLLIGGTVLVAALIRHPMVRIRSIVACCGTVLTVLLGRAYSVMCVTENASPASLIDLFTGGFAALMLLGSFCDAVFRVCRPPQQPKKAAKRAPAKK